MTPFHTRYDLDAEEKSLTEALRADGAYARSEGGRIPRRIQQHCRLEAARTAGVFGDVVLTLLLPA